MTADAAKAVQKNSSASARLHCGLTLDRLLLGKGHHLRSSKRSAAIKSAKMVRASTPQLLLHQQQWRLQPGWKLFWIVEMRRASAMAVMRSDARWGTGLHHRDGLVHQMRDRDCQQLARRLGQKCVPVGASQQLDELLDDFSDRPPPRSECCTARNAPGMRP